mgnify:CR=1 FL=1
MAESDEQFLSKYEPDKDEAFLAQYAPDQDEKFLEGFAKKEPGTARKVWDYLTKPLPGPAEAVFEAEKQVRRVATTPIHPSLGEKETASPAELAILAARSSLFPVPPKVMVEPGIAAAEVQIPQSRLDFALLGLPPILRVGKAAVNAVISKTAGAIDLGDLAKMVGVAGEATGDVGKPAAILAEEAATAEKISKAEGISANISKYKGLRDKAIKAADVENIAAADELRAIQVDERALRKTLEKQEQSLFNVMADKSSPKTRQSRVAGAQAEIARTKQDLAEIPNRYTMAKQRATMAADRLTEAKGLPVDPPPMTQAEAQAASVVADETAKLAAVENTRKAGAGTSPPYTSKPSDSAAFPGAAAHTDRISPERLEAAKAYINPSRFINEPAQDIIVAMAEDPATQKALLAQKRGVIPLEASRKAGKALGATPEDFMALKPGQALPKGTPDAQVSAAVLVQRAMADDLAESAALHAKGIPIEELSDRVVRAYDSIIGAQGIISETGRGLSAARLTPKEKAMKLLARNLLKDEVMENPEKLSAFLKMIADLPKDQIAQRIIAAKRLIPVERSVVGMLLEARGAALLTNPLTYLRNTAGNSLAAMTRHAELASTGGLDFLYSTLTGKPQTRYAMEAKAMLSGEWKAIGRAAKDGLAVLLDETVARGFAAEQVLAGGQIPGTIGKVVRLPFRILNATDTFFRTILANGEMGRLAYLDAVKNGLTGTARAERIQQLMAAPSEEMLTSALSVAREYTFQKPLDGIAALGAKALATPGAGPFLRFIVPFYKTPVNIAKFIVERTPVLSELTKSGVLRSTILSSNQTKEQILEAVSKNLMGLGAMTSAAVALKWKEGVITGAPPKDRIERENLEATGWKPYHIKLGGLYLNYRGIEPLASFLAGVADFAKFGEDNPEANQDEKAMKLMGSAVKNFFNQPFLQGLKDVFDFIENPEGFQGRARFAQLAASVVPSGVGVIARATNPIRRNPEGILEAMAARTPILQDRVRPKLTRWGEPIVNTSWFFGLLDEPLPASDPVEAKLRDLGLTKVIGFPSDRVGHGKGAVKMNKDEYNELLQLRGKAMRETVQKLLKHPQFSVIQKHQQRALLERNEHQITDAAMDQMRGKVALRAHGINDQLLPDEMAALGSRLQMPDFWDMERSRQKTVLFDFVKRIKALR